jgi:hypothetical protein
MEGVVLGIDYGAPPGHETEGHLRPDGRGPLGRFVPPVQVQPARARPLFCAPLHQTSVLCPAFSGEDREAAPAPQAARRDHDILPIDGHANRRAERIRGGKGHTYGTLRRARRRRTSGRLRFSFPLALTSQPSSSFSGRHATRPVSSTVPAHSGVSKEASAEAVDQEEPAHLTKTRPKRNRRPNTAVFGSQWRV